MSVYFETGAFFEEGAFFESAALPQPPTAIDIGAPGNAIFALPFRGIGASIADLDMLYGLVGHEEALEDILPIFLLGTRLGQMRAYGMEIPRPAIRDQCVESFATLLDVDDMTVEANPAGTNLFGFVGLTTRPVATVTIDNSDGHVTELDARELLLGCPAGLHWDIGHQAFVRELVGVVSAVVLDGTRAQITFGMSARRTRAPNITD
jgi:hypothetical protein